MGLPPIGVNQASIVTPFRQTCDTRSGTLFVVSRNEPVGASEDFMGDLETLIVPTRPPCGVCISYPEQSPSRATTGTRQRTSL
jgi:hypothetical protein